MHWIKCHIFRLNILMNPTYETSILLCEYILYDMAADWSNLVTCIVS